MNDNFPMIFCKIPYLQYYDGTECPTMPEGMNFLPVTITDEAGAACDLLFGALSKKHRLPLEHLGISRDTPFLTNATVIFCAAAENGSFVTVGWYRYANVTWTPEFLPCENEDGSPYEHSFFFCCKADAAVLLPEDIRMQTEWRIPRNRTNAASKFGFSADAVWFADEAAAESWKKRFADTITSYCGDNWLQDDTTKELSIP